MREYAMVIFRFNFFKSREGVPVHFAVIGFGTAWTRAFGSLVESAESGVEAQFANVREPQLTDTPAAFLLAVIAIGDDVA